MTANAKLRDGYDSTPGSSFSTISRSEDMSTFLTTVKSVAVRQEVGSSAIYLAETQSRAVIERGRQSWCLSSEPRDEDGPVLLMPIPIGDDRVEDQLTDEAVESVQTSVRRPCGRRSESKCLSDA